MFVRGAKRGLQPGGSTNMSVELERLIVLAQIHVGTSYVMHESEAVPVTVRM